MVLLIDVHLSRLFASDVLRFLNKVCTVISLIILF